MRSGSTISGALAAGGVSIAFGASGFAIAWIARSAIAVRPPVSGPCGPPIEIVMTGTSGSADARPHIPDVAHIAPTKLTCSGERHDEHPAQAFGFARPILQHRADGFLHAYRPSFGCAASATLSTPARFSSSNTE